MHRAASRGREKALRTLISKKVKVGSKTNEISSYHHVFFFSQHRRVLGIYLFLYCSSSFLLAALVDVRKAADKIIPLA